MMKTERNFITITGTAIYFAAVSVILFIFDSITWFALLTLLFFTYLMPFYYKYRILTIGQPAKKYLPKLIPYLMPLVLICFVTLFTGWKSLSKGKWINEETANITFTESTVKGDTTLQIRNIHKGDIYLNYLDNEISVLQRDSTGENVRQQLLMNFSKLKTLRIEKINSNGQKVYWEYNGVGFSYSDNFFRGFQGFLLTKHLITHQQMKRFSPL